MATVRAVRNNNPLNIRVGDKWQGLLPQAEMTPAQRAETAFCVFRSPVYGFRAAAVLLLQYQRTYGLRTVGAMIARWAPPNENETARYAGFVANDMGIPVDQPFDFRDFALASRMLKAMARVESGGDHFGDADITAGLVAAGLRPPGHGGGVGAAAAVLLLPLGGVLSLAAAALFAGSAHAAEAADAAYQAAVHGLLDWAIGLAFAVLGPLVLWAVHWAERRLGLQRHEQACALFETAALNGLTYAREMALRGARDLHVPEVRDQLVRDAAVYVNQTVPQAAARLGLSDDGIRQRLLARLDRVAPLPVLSADTLPATLRPAVQR